MPTEVYYIVSLHNSVQGVPGGGQRGREEAEEGDGGDQGQEQEQEEGEEEEEAAAHEEEDHGHDDDDGDVGGVVDDDGVQVQGPRQEPGQEQLAGSPSPGNQSE